MKRMVTIGMGLKILSIANPTPSKTSSFTQMKTTCYKTATIKTPKTTTNKASTYPNPTTSTTSMTKT